MKNRKRTALIGLLAVGWFSRCGGGGCGGAIAQSQECRDYIDCYAKVGGIGELDNTYGAAGVCWTTNSAKAVSCTQTCKSTTLTLKASYPDAGC
jgi:hypothetical protein